MQHVLVKKKKISNTAVFNACMGQAFLELFLWTHDLQMFKYLFTSEPPQFAGINSSLKTLTSMVPRSVDCLRDFQSCSTGPSILEPA